MIHRIIYISDARPGFSEADLKQVLAVSRRNNARAGLSGLLIVHEGRFFQVLEGERATVQARYARILRDPRHRNLSVVQDGPAKERAFGQWKMGFRQPGDLDPSLRDSVLSICDLVPPNSPARGRDERVRLRGPQLPRRFPTPRQNAGLSGSAAYFADFFFFFDLALPAVLSLFFLSALRLSSWSSSCPQPWPFSSCLSCPQPWSSSCPLSSRPWPSSSSPSSSRPWPSSCPPSSRVSMPCPQPCRRRVRRECLRPAASRARAVPQTGQARRALPRGRGRRR